MTRDPRDPADESTPSAAHERDAREQRYRLQSEQLAIILEGVADGITAQRPDGSLLYANDAAAHLCGYPSAQALMSAPPSEVLLRFDVFDDQGNPFDWS